MDVGLIMPVSEVDVVVLCFGADGPSHELGAVDKVKRGPLTSSRQAGGGALASGGRIAAAFASLPTELLQGAVDFPSMEIEITRAAATLALVRQQGKEQAPLRSTIKESSRSPFSALCFPSPSA